MKKLLVIAFLIMFGMTMSEGVYAQKKKREMVKATISTDIHCGSCKARIMNNAASFGSGVKSVEVDVEKNLIFIVYDKSKTDIKDVIEKITKLKFKDVKLKKEEPVKTKKK